MDDRTGAAGDLLLPGPSGAPGLSAGAPEVKMGLTASPTTQLHSDGVPVPAERLVGDEGEGWAIAMTGPGAGRLGTAACATGPAQAALDVAVPYAGEREQCGQPVARFQVLSLATYPDAARRLDRGLPATPEAAIANWCASGSAMRVTTDAVQALEGYGCTKDFPAERCMREAMVTQIFKGTN